MNNNDNNDNNDIQRKHSFSYVEFIRGTYDENDIKSFQYLLNLMTKTEIDQIITNEFKTLWNELWQKTSKHIAFQKEFETSQKKFNYIKKNFNLLEYINFKNLYESTEWGFPKGRRDKNEKNLDCAIREFKEETGIESYNYVILNRLNTIEETVIGLEKYVFKLVYYIGLSFNENKLEIITEHQKYETSDIKWMTYEELIPKIREYYLEKIKIIHKIFFMIINLIENIYHDNEILGITLIN